MNVQVSVPYSCQYSVQLEVLGLEVLKKLSPARGTSVLPID